MVVATALLVVGALGAIGSGIAADQKSRKAARRAKREARRQEALIKQEGLFQAGRLGVQTRRLRASQRAAIGAAGIQQDSGLAEELALETLAESTLEQSRILQGAGRRRAALLASANERARAIRAQGQSALIGGFLQGIGGGANAATAYQQFQFNQERGTE